MRNVKRLGLFLPLFIFSYLIPVGLNQEEVNFFDEHIKLLSNLTENVLRPMAKIRASQKRIDSFFDEDSATLVISCFIAVIAPFIASLIIRGLRCLNQKVRNFKQRLKANKQKRLLKLNSKKTMEVRLNG